MSKQTAVEWLVEQLEFDVLVSNDDIKTVIEQGLAMEREQRFEDFKGGFQAATDAIIGANKSVQSKTYGKEASHEG